MINRLILWVALAGMILALHLWIQKARNFDQGCLGLDSHATVAEMPGGCREVGTLPASHLLGVSNAAWGYAFYFGLAVISFGKIVTRARTARRLHTVGEMAVALALIYSAYLVYEMASAKAWCVLCTSSAGLIAILAGLHLVLRMRGGFQGWEEPERAMEFRSAVGAIFTASGILVGVLLFVDRLGTRPLDQGSTHSEFIQLVGEALPRYIDGAKLMEMRACHFDWDAPPLPPGSFTDSSTPYIGKPGGPEVIIFYDPNCPHCRAYHEKIFEPLIEKLRDRVRFTIVPRILWDESTRQVEALKLAEQSGKYFDLWRLMFAQQPGPHHAMSVDEIAAIYAKLGLDTTNLAARLEAERDTVEATNRRAKAVGIDVVPIIYIDGNQVWASNHSEACVSRLIEHVVTSGDPHR